MLCVGLGNLVDTDVKIFENGLLCLTMFQIFCINSQAGVDPRVLTLVSGGSSKDVL